MHTKVFLMKSYVPTFDSIGQNSISNYIKWFWLTFFGFYSSQHHKGSLGAMTSPSDLLGSQ